MFQDDNAQSMPKAAASATGSSTTTVLNEDVISRNDRRETKRSLVTWQHPASGNENMRKDFSDGEIVVLQPNTSLLPRRAKAAFLDPSSRPRASVGPFQVAHPETVTENDREQASSCPPQLAVQPFPLSAFGNERTAHNVDRNSSPSPPKDPYPTTDEHNSKSMSKSEDEISKPSVTVKRVEKQQQRKELVTGGDDGKDSVEGDLVAPDVLDGAKFTRADQISIRPDTMRAAKRRSWALLDNSPSDETEYIRRILLDEQKKGRTHLLVGYDIGNLFPASNKGVTSLCKAECVREGVDAAEDTDSTPTEYPYELLGKDIHYNEVPAKTEQQLGEPVSAEDDASEEKMEVTGDTVAETSVVAGPLKPAPTKGVTSLCKTKFVREGVEAAEDTDSTPTEYPYELLGKDIHYNEVPAKTEQQLGEPGILRSSGAKNCQKTVLFDPLALLLDAALEGEVDLVKASASKLSDISACNDEGITALHNAICAGHYEIVRYLVDSGANVNAQDSDGWTPLHCAASCNNLPMVKLLVENGACIFAQTLSDLETPAEKCEEDEDGYEGCQLYLKAADQGAGSVNSGYMYAAYDYDKEQEDELSFRAGDRLLVLERNCCYKAWWLCQTTLENNTEKGLAPSNYLSLYPSVSKRSADFRMFDIPQVPKLRAEKVEGRVNCSTATDEKISAFPVASEDLVS